MQFEKREEYFLTAQTTIMVVEGQEEGWLHSKEKNLKPWMDKYQK